MIRTSNSNKNFGNDIKIIVVGNSNAGKTSFVNKWIKNIFIENYKATILSEFNSKIYEKNGKIYRVQIWDIAGQDRSAVITKIFSKDCKGAIIVSDITNPSMLKESLNWKNSINDCIDIKDLPIMLIENKSDLISDYSKSNQDFINFGKINKFSGYFRTSSKTGMNINESMEFFLNVVIKNTEKLSKLNSKEQNTSIIIDRTFSKDKNLTNKGNCC